MHKFALLWFCTLSCFGQNLENTIDSLNGIWIAEDYYNSFEVTKTPLKSRDVFDYGYPVALRVRSSENNNGVLNIGYSVLHDHMLHPEVSQYVVHKEDSIREQGRMKINLRSKDSLGYYKTSSIYYFNFNWVSYINFDARQNQISLFRPQNDVYKTETIVYKRITSSFNDNYPFPNPLYFYTRKTCLIGNYTLLDHKGKVLSNNLSISENGKVKGYELLDNFTAYVSTDIYCGLPSTDDTIIFLQNVLDQNGEAYVFLFTRDNNGNLTLYESELAVKNKLEHYTLGDKVYELVKNYP